MADWREENKRLRAMYEMMDDPQGGTVQGIDSGYTLNRPEGLGSGSLNAHSQMDSIINENELRSILKNMRKSVPSRMEILDILPIENSGSVDAMANRLFTHEDFPRKRTSILEKIANSPVGDLGNPIIPLLRALGLSSRDNQSIGAEIREHLANKKREKGVNSILQNYVKGLMEDEEGIPGLQGGPPLNNNKSLDTRIKKPFY